MLKAEVHITILRAKQLLRKIHMATQDGCRWCADLPPCDKTILTLITAVKKCKQNVLVYTIRYITLHITTNSEQITPLTTAEIRIWKTTRMASVTEHSCMSGFVLSKLGFTDSWCTHHEFSHFEIR